MVFPVLLIFDSDSGFLQFPRLRQQHSANASSSSCFAHMNLFARDCVWSKRFGGVGGMHIFSSEHILEKQSSLTEQFLPSEHCAHPFPQFLSVSSPSVSLLYQLTGAPGRS